MNKKVKRALFEISKNSRITTKNLSKQIKTSQQSASYLMKQLKKKKLIRGFTSIIDPAKFGYTNVIVGFNYLDFDKQKKKDILDVLNSVNTIISIQEADQGMDLIVEYSVKNLSAFNKTHSEIAHRFHKSLEIKFIMPVIVKHLFLRKYLMRKSQDMDIILCGDRDVYPISDSELMVLEEFNDNPIKSYTNISQSTTLSVKTIMNIKKKLEKITIIKGYSCIPDFSKFGINRCLLFLRLSSQSIGETDKLVEYSRVNKQVVGIAKIIGNFQLMLTIEELEEQKSKIIKELRATLMIDEYFLVKIENINKETYLPKDLFQ